MALHGDFIAVAQGIHVKLDSCQLSRLTLLCLGDLTQGFSREESDVMSEAGRDKVFISYSHKDKTWLGRLQTMLEPLVRKDSIAVWDDTKIKAGAQWARRNPYGSSNG